MHEYIHHIFRTVILFIQCTSITAAFYHVELKIQSPGSSFTPWRSLNGILLLSGNTKINKSRFLTKQSAVVSIGSQYT